jgi:hypothetical protein
MKRRRQERAYARRVEQLKTGTYPDQYSPTGERCINKEAAKLEIAGLERKLVGFNISALTEEEVSE